MPAFAVSVWAAKKGRVAVSNYMSVLDCAVGDFVQWQTQFWRIVAIREPSNGVAGAHGAMVVDIDCWSETLRVWRRSPITVWPHDHGRWDVIPLPLGEAQKMFPVLP